jgi:hypothetical protein
VRDPGRRRALQRDRVEFLASGNAARLHYVDLNVVRWLVVRLHSPVKPASVIKPGVNISKEVLCCNWRAPSIYLCFDHSEIGFDRDRNDLAGSRGDGCK